MPNYFSEEAVKEDVLKFKTNQDYALLEKHTNDFVNLIKGVIFTHKLQTFASYDDLKQEGFCVLYECIDKYNPDYGPIFGYLSVAVKFGLINYTKKKNSRNGDLSFDEALYQEQETNSEEFVFAKEDLMDIELGIDEKFENDVKNCIMNLKTNSKGDLVYALTKKYNYKTDEVIANLEAIKKYLMKKKLSEAKEIIRS